MDVSRLKATSRMLEVFHKTYDVEPLAFQQVGLLVVAWSMFDQQLEQIIWRLERTKVAGIRPRTDKVGSEDRIKMFRTAAATYPVPEWRRISADVAETAQMVLDVRNTIGHGMPTPFGGTMRNRPLEGELRARQLSTAFLMPTMLELALSAVIQLQLFSIEILRLNTTLPVDEVVAHPKVLARANLIRSAMRDASEARDLPNHGMPEDY